MRSRDIVRKAWQITQVHLKKLIWYGITPAFFTLVITTAYLVYQYEAFMNSVFLTGADSVDVLSIFKMTWGIASSHPKLSVVFTVLAIIFFVCYIILPPIFNGTMISAIMRIKQYKQIDGSFEVGVRHFFPMFEFALLSGAFSIRTLFTESSFILRWWGESIYFMFLPVLLFIATIGIIVSFLFTYTEFFIVLEGKSLIKSLMESTILVVSNLRKTFLVFVLMMLIGVRILLNMLLVLIVPMIAIFLAGYFATTIYSMAGLIIIGIFSVLMLFLSSYLLGLFHVFATAVWVITFSYLTERGKEEKEKEEEVI